MYECDRHTDGRTDGHLMTAKKRTHQIYYTIKRLRLSYNKLTIPPNHSVGGPCCDEHHSRSAWQLNKFYCITLASNFTTCFCKLLAVYWKLCGVYLQEYRVKRGVCPNKCTLNIIPCHSIPDTVFRGFAKSQILVRTPAMFSFSEPALRIHAQLLRPLFRLSVCLSNVNARQLRVNRGLFAENIYTTCLSSETRTCRALVRLVQQTEQCKWPQR